MIAKSFHLNLKQLTEKTNMKTAISGGSYTLLVRTELKKIKIIEIVNKPEHRICCRE